MINENSWEKHLFTAEVRRRDRREKGLIFVGRQQQILKFFYRMSSVLKDVGCAGNCTDKDTKEVCFIQSPSPDWIKG